MTTATAFTDEQAKQVIDAVIAAATNPDEIAKLELFREFAFNTEFRNAFAKQSFEATR